MNFLSVVGKKSTFFYFLCKHHTDGGLESNSWNYSDRNPFSLPTAAVYFLFLYLFLTNARVLTWTTLRFSDCYYGTRTKSCFSFVSKKEPAGQTETWQSPLMCSARLKEHLENNNILLVGRFSDIPGGSEGRTKQAQLPNNRPRARGRENRIPCAVGELRSRRNWSSDPKNTRRADTTFWNPQQQHRPSRGTSRNTACGVQVFPLQVFSRHT